MDQRDNLKIRIRILRIIYRWIEVIIDTLISHRVLLILSKKKGKVDVIVQIWRKINKESKNLNERASKQFKLFENNLDKNMNDLKENNSYINIEKLSSFELK